MIKSVMGFIRRLNPVLVANNASCSDDARETALNVLEKHGLEAFYYLPSIGLRHDRELSDALDLLAHRGYLITDKSGQPVGRFAKARPSADEIAAERRATFSIVQGK